jgi:hypothetical protein
MDIQGMWSLRDSSLSERTGGQGKECIIFAMFVERVTMRVRMCVGSVGSRSVRKPYVFRKFAPFPVLSADVC